MSTKALHCFSNALKRRKPRDVGFSYYEAQSLNLLDVLSESFVSARAVVLPKCVSGSVTGLGHALAKLITKLSISDLSGVVFH